MTKKTMDLKSIILLIIIFLVVALLGGVIIDKINGYFEEANEKYMERVNQLITSYVNSNLEKQRVIDEYTNVLMKLKSQKIVDQLEKKDVFSLSSETLADLANEHDITGISIFKKVPDNIVIAASSNAKEVGLKTARWGYWYEAFSQLFKFNEVKINKGYSNENFWVGPVTFSATLDGYFKYSYYKTEDMEYLLNIFLNLSDASTFSNRMTLNNYLDQVVDADDNIIEIGVVDLKSYSSVIQTEKKKDIGDPILQYGKYTYHLPSDIVSVSELLNNKEKVQVKFYKDNKEYIKTFQRLTDKIGVIYIIDRTNTKVFNENIYMMISFLILLGIIIISFLMSYLRNMHKKTVKMKKEQLEFGKKLKSTIDNLPSIVLRLNMDENENIIIDYSEGELMDYLSLTTDEIKGKSFEAIFDSELVEYLLPSIKKGFKLLYGETKFYYNGLFYRVDITPEIVGSQIFVVCYGLDVSEVEDTPNKTDQIQLLDEKVEIPNRYFLMKKVNYLIKEQESFTMMLLEIKHLDQYYEEKTEVLKEVILRLEKIISHNKFLAYLENDEIAILVEETVDKDIVITIARDILWEINQLVDFGEEKIGISANIGVSRYPIDDVSPNMIFKYAEIALYNSKEAGENNFLIY